MSCYLQKCFLIFLSLYAFSAQAMKRKCGDTNGQELNLVLVKTVESVLENKFFNQEECEKVQEIIQKRADVNCKIGKKEQTSLLKLTIEYNKKDLVNFLLQNNADVNAKNAYGLTPLIALFKMADQKGIVDLEILENLLKYKANPDGSPTWAETPLTLAASAGAIKVITLLVTHNADIDLRDHWGFSPLGRAIQHQKQEAIKELCNLGASLYRVNGLYHTAFHASVGLPKEYIETLITHGYEVNFYHQTEKQLRDTIIESLLIFRKINIPKDLQWYILAKLGIDKESSQKLIQIPALVFVNKRVEYIIRVLRHYNHSGALTALQYLQRSYGNNNLYTNEVKELFNVHELKKAHDTFKIGFPNILKSHSSNVVCQMYMNCIKLLNNVLPRPCLQFEI